MLIAGSLAAALALRQRNRSRLRAVVVALPFAGWEGLVNAPGGRTDEDGTVRVFIVAQDQTALPAGSWAATVVAGEGAVERLLRELA